MRDDTQNGPQLLAGLLAGFTNAKGWRQQLDAHSLFLHWESIVDPTINTHARPLKIVGNVLWLEISNSAWMQQLQFQKLQLLETVNKTLRLSPLTDIRFTLASDRPSETQGQPAVRFVQPSLAEQNSFQQQLAGIEDEKIRDSLMSLWYLSHSCLRN